MSGLTRPPRKTLQTALLQLALNPLRQRVPAEQTANCFWDPVSGTKIDRRVLLTTQTAFHAPALGPLSTCLQWSQAEEQGCALCLGHFFIQKNNQGFWSAPESARTVHEQVAADARQAIRDRLASIDTCGLDSKKHCEEAVSPLTRSSRRPSRAAESFVNTAYLAAASLPEPHAQAAPI